MERDFITHARTALDGIEETLHEKAEVSDMIEDMIKEHKRFIQCLFCMICSLI